MGNYWLHDLPNHLRSRGIPVGTYPGWEVRSRSTGGLEKILAVGTHHDAVKAGTPSINRFRYAWDNAAARPIGNAWVLKNGTVMMGAAGATNTQGRSERDIPVSKGIIPKSRGNLYMISFEAENDGIGEVWTETQLEVYEAVCAATCELYDLNPIFDILHHWQYTSRKIDPYGPTENRNYGPNMWTTDFQKRVSKLLPNFPVESDEPVLVGYVRLKGTPAVYRQFSDGTKKWVKNQDELSVYAFIEGKTLDQMRASINDLPNAAWIQAAGVIVGPIPPGVDAWGVPK